MSVLPYPLSRRRQARLATRHLPTLVAVGVVGRDELEALGSPRGRRAAMRVERRVHGREAARALRAVHAAAVAVAVHREHSARGRSEPRSAEREAQLAAMLIAARERLAAARAAAQPEGPDQPSA